MPNPHTFLYHPKYAQVALNTPVSDYFDYVVSDVIPQIGARVRVSFGTRTLVGIVVGLSEHTAIEAHKLKPIISVIDEVAILPKTTLDLAKFLSAYYFYPLGETLFVMLPKLFKAGNDTPSAEFWQICADVDVATLGKSKKLVADFEYLHAHFADNPFSAMQANLPVATLKKLQAKGLLNNQIQSSLSLPPPQATLKNTPLNLNSEQQIAVDTINNAVDTDNYHGFLLEGVTGSGKTEVYLQAIEHTLQQNKQVLVLVPEIGLTPQTQARFFERFYANIVVLTSKVNDNARFAGFLACLTGQAQIVIATRSACFYPFANLGLIIIDEAHDGSYKQQDGLRYHACDVSLYLASKIGAVVVLGSATPSLNHLHLHQTGKLQKIKLTQRINHIKPRYRITDKRVAKHFHQNMQGQMANSDLSHSTITAIKERLNKGEQVLIFLNRRGYAPIVLCQACGHQFDCPRCTSHLTLHKKQQSTLHCHHCNYHTSLPLLCPSCNSSNLSTLGQGTSQLFEHLHALFANPQSSVKTYPILQIDKDTTKNKNDWQNIYNQVNTGAPMILVGTQMLAKGHHFANVTLVVIVDADAGFLSPDFRSPELACQQIMQVAGRAGRTDKSGDVIIQTLRPDNALLLTLIKDGYPKAAQLLLNERQSLGLPPFSYTAVIHAHSKDKALAENTLITLKNMLHRPEFKIIAPIDAPLAKKNNLHQVQLVISTHDRKLLHHALTHTWPIAKKSANAKLRLMLDIDPLGW